MQSLLDSEAAVIKELEAQYKRALNDINGKVKLFQADIDLLDQALSQDGLDDNLRARLQSQKRSKIYQQNYQKALQGQISGVLDKMQADNYSTIDSYLKSSYETGYIGTMYDIAGQGIPIIAPINQAAAVKAILTDSKISKGLYNALGVDVGKLKKSIAQEISRGIASALPYRDIARNISNVSKTPLSRAKTIARTEGHRIQQTSARDAQQAAKSKGADVLKQWDAALDGRTRDSHRMVDGENRELDEKFSNGLMFPGDPNGSAAEVVNCRCTSDTRARWALDEEELNTLKERAEYFGLDKTKNFEAYKEKYLQLPENADKIGTKPERVPNVFSENLEKLGVEYNQVMPHKQPVTEKQIITALAGGDRTRGSCASVGLAYAGQKCGFDVLDFRNGKSRDFFSTYLNLHGISELPGMVTIRKTTKNSVTGGNQLLKLAEKGKEYYLVCGKHAAIVRRTDNDILQYLELQSARDSGWHNFDGNPRYTLKWRFGEVKGFTYESFMIDVGSFKDCKEFPDILGYLNTAKEKQVKGNGGTIK